MSEQSTTLGYLGPEFQEKVFWQILTEPDFGNKIMDHLDVSYFDNDNMKKLFKVIKNYSNEYGKAPNLSNKSIFHAIGKYHNQSDITEEEILKNVVNKIDVWNRGVLNRQIDSDGEAIRKETMLFIKQQEYAKFGYAITQFVSSGKIKDKDIVSTIDEMHEKIAAIGDDEDYGTEIFDNMDGVFRKEFREPVATGIKAIDDATGGGLGKGEMGIILAASGVGKAQPLTSKLLTPYGWIKMGDVNVGDYVIGSNGLEQKVTNIFPQGIRKIYKVLFNDNTYTYCDIDHLWSVNSRKQRTQKTKINGKHLSIPDNSFQVLKTSEMIDDVRVKNGMFNYKIPNLEPVEFDEREVKINPYVMGMLLGDGCITKKNQPHIITSDDFIVKKVSSLDNFINVQTYEKEEIYKTIYRISLLKRRKYLEILNLYGCDSSTKFIPNNYLYNNKKNRESLLQGLIDSDGTITTNGRIIYTTVSKKLCDGVKELVLSLGGSCRITEKQKLYKNKMGDKILGKLSYNLTISFPNNGIVPCSLPKKLERFVYRDKYEFNKFISSIEYSHEEEAQCIVVENDDSLYVTDDYILTHNSTVLTFLANHAVEMDNNVLQIIFEDTPDQIKRKHYVKWTPQAELLTFDDDFENERIRKAVEKKKQSIKGNLVIKRFPQEGITMPKIYQWIKKYEKKNGIKFNILLLDYLDCVESHKKSGDQTMSEIAVVKYFESMCAELNIPCWTAIQSNRSGFNAEWIDANQMGGSIKRAQKSHFLMSIAKTDEQNREGKANIKIIKSRFGQSGLLFENAIFDNNTMEIKIFNSSNSGFKKRTELEKPSIEKLLDKQPKVTEMEDDLSNFNIIDLMKNNKGIEEEIYDDNYELVLNKEAETQERLEKTK
jgi:hypothetical protein